MLFLIITIFYTSQYSPLVAGAVVNGANSPVHDPVFLFKGGDVVRAMEVVLPAAHVRAGLAPELAVHGRRVTHAAPLGRREPQAVEDRAPRPASSGNSVPG